MKSRARFSLVFGALLAALMWSGCSTPESRIRRSPELFAQLSRVEQEMIERGQVGLGFTPEMVRLALGEPDRVRTRTDSDGTGEVWSYVTYEGPDGGLLYRGWYHRDYLWGSRLYPYYMNVPARREREHFRVVFRDHRVVSIEQESRR